MRITEGGGANKLINCGRAVVNNKCFDIFYNSNLLVFYVICSDIGDFCSLHVNRYYITFLVYSEET